MTAATLVSLVEAEAHLADLLDDLGDKPAPPPTFLQVAAEFAHAETLPPSPVADAMRHLADEEAEYRRARQHQLELAGGGAA